MANRPLLVVATPQGQLGNTLMHFAHIRAYASKHRLPMVHLAFERYAESFPATCNDLFSSYSPDGPIGKEPLVIALIGLFKTFLTVLAKSGNSIPPDLLKVILDSPPEAVVSVTSPEMRHILMMFGCALVEWIAAGQFKQMPVELVRPEGSETLELSRDARMERLLGEQRMIIFDGWLVRDHDAFNELYPSFRDFFAPTPEINARIDKVIATLRGGSDLLCGVHIRRGDYKTFAGGRYYWEPEQYAAWMSKIAASIPERRIGFLVCSDEKFNKDRFAGLTVEFGPGDPVGDMYSLSKCDAIFGPSSTFTEWAAAYRDVPLFFMQSAEHPVDGITAALRKKIT